MWLSGSTLHTEGVPLERDGLYSFDRGNVCPARAKRYYFSTNYPNFSPRFTLSWSTLHNKAIAMNSTTPNVICIVLNKQHWSHKCGCQYIQHNSALQTHHKL